jgi:hypothetical protein
VILQVGDLIEEPDGTLSIIKAINNLDSTCEFITDSTDKLTGDPEWSMNSNNILYNVGYRGWKVHRLNV